MSANNVRPADTPTQSGVALVISGAAAKGGYAAGALAELALDPRFEVTALVGASSGALNGAVFAAGTRAGRAKEAAELLCSLWAKRATVGRIWSFEQRRNIVRGALEKFRQDARRTPVRLHLVVTSLEGRLGRFGYVRHEEAHHFTSEAFEEPGQLDRMAELCVASGEIPLVFPPIRLRNGEFYWDGGVVNNTPLSLALHGGQPRGSRQRRPEHIVVLSPEPNAPRPGHFGRFSIGRLLEIIVEERLARDLVEARSFNEELAALQARLQVLLGRPFSLDELGPSLDWQTIELMEVRPSTELDGNFLSGFFSAREREKHIAAGREAAKAARRKYGTNPPG